MNRHVFIRVDGNVHIGSGHVMRCLSLAKALRAENAVCSFVLADETMENVVAQEGFDVCVLHTQWNDLTAETDAMLAVLEKNRPLMLVVDTYYVTEMYLRTLNGVVPVVYIDDLNAFDYPVRCVVNYNIYADQLHYSPNKRYILGSAYAPLREEFAQRKLCFRKTAENVLISTGGADVGNVAAEILYHCLKSDALRGLKFHLIVGALNAHKEALRELVRDDRRVILHENVADMANLMQGCDVAISAAGSTLYELCACGVPTVTFATADNQLTPSACFSQKGLMLNAGDMRDGKQKTSLAVVHQLQKLAGDDRLRYDTALKMQRMVDGCGAGRLAKKLLNEENAS